MFYNVKYKLQHQWFWRTIKKIKGDGVIEGGYPARYLILEDETRIELPASAIVCFSKERFYVIKQTMEKQIGNNITV